jgi:DNA-binding NtrC family response regulator
MKRLMIVDPDPAIVSALTGAFAAHDDLESRQADSAEAAREMLRREPVDLVVTELAIPRAVDGVKFLAFVKSQVPGARCILMTGADSALLAATLKTAAIQGHYRKPLALDALTADALTALGETPGPAGSPPAAGARSSDALPDALDDLKRQLARIMGPVSQIIFDNAVKQWRDGGGGGRSDLPELVRIICREIDDPGREKQYRGSVAHLL